LLVVILVVGIALTYLLETQVLLAELNNELERQAMLVASLVASYPRAWSDPTTAREFVALIGERLTAQMMLFGTDGTLIASTDPADDKSLGQRFDVPGLSQVLLTGAAVRVDQEHSQGTGAADVLVPVRIGRSIVGVIRLSDPLASVYGRFARTRTLIILVLAGGLLVGSAVGWFLALDLERPLRHAAQAISAMAGG
jgi:sensor histidine kinase regulating citrate/malate metabolism